MDVASLYADPGLGFLIARALAAWVPKRFWVALLLIHPTPDFGCTDQRCGWLDAGANKH